MITFLAKSSKVGNSLISLNVLNTCKRISEEKTEDSYSLWLFKSFIKKTRYLNFEKLRLMTSFTVRHSYAVKSHLACRLLWNNEYLRRLNIQMLCLYWMDSLIISGWKETTWYLGSGGMGGGTGERWRWVFFHTAFSFDTCDMRKPWSGPL